MDQLFWPYNGVKALTCASIGLTPSTLSRGPPKRQKRIKEKGMRQEKNMRMNRGSRQEERSGGIGLAISMTIIGSMGSTFCLSSFVCYAANLSVCH